MSLVRLLTAGKSLVGLGEPASRYRMRSGYQLPKFGSAKNPFAQPEETQAEPAPADAAGTTTIAKYQMTPTELAAARLKETKRLPQATIAAMQAADAQAAGARTAKSASLRSRLVKLANIAVRGAVAWLKSLLQKFNPLAWWAARKAQPKPAIPRFGKAAAVQGELSLDNIKVVRNDLNESDVELVPAKPVTTRKAPVGQAEMPEPIVEETVELIKT